MSYSRDTEYAMRNLIELASEEETLLRDATARLGEAEAELKVYQWDFQTSDLSEDFPDAYVMAAFARAGQAGAEVDELRGQVATLQAAVGAHQFAVQAICGAILQVAKQGVSVVHGGLGAAPNGRVIGTSVLKDVIWQGRNQAIHFEEGNFRPAVVVLFAALEASHGQKFSLARHPNQSLAKQVVDLLGWHHYPAYLVDAQDIGLA